MEAQVTKSLSKNKAVSLLQLLWRDGEHMFAGSLSDDAQLCGAVPQGPIVRPESFQLCQ